MTGRRARIGRAEAASTGLETWRTSRDAFENTRPPASWIASPGKESRESSATFRQALDRGERPALEAYLPEHGTQRKDALIELVHEEMEFRIKAGESSVLGSYLERFPEIVDDPRALGELVAAESDLRRRMTAEAARSSAVAAEEAAVRRGRRPASAATSWGT